MSDERECCCGALLHLISGVVPETGGVLDFWVHVDTNDSRCYPRAEDESRDCFATPVMESRPVGRAARQET